MLKQLIFLVLSTSLFAQEEITPIPLTISYDEQKAALGKELFFDPILSHDGTIACVSCHHLPGSGADTVPRSVGVNGAKGNINTPTVLNSVFNFVQFWDGRAKSLDSQLMEPITNPLEMGSTVEEVLEKLEESSYKQKFAKIYTSGVNEKNLIEVIAEFEKALITPNSRFDQYLRGDYNALNAQELRGYKKFQELGCITCHNGVNIGSNMYQKIGIMIEYDHSVDDSVINGRYDETKRLRDKRVFKVPTLRNIALTAPYLHDGTAETLRDAIIDMREHQLGILEENEDIDEIEAFLRTLTGEMPAILKELE